MFGPCARLSPERLGAPLVLQPGQCLTSGSNCSGRPIADIDSRQLGDVHGWIAATLEVHVLVELLYFEGCPHYRAFAEHLDRLIARIELSRQGLLDPSRRFTGGKQAEVLGLPQPESQREGRGTLGPRASGLRNGMSLVSPQGRNTRMAT